MKYDGKGYVHIYTGNGKGKTTAAIGLAIRALGSGRKVYFCQFMKELSYSEHKILLNLSPDLVVESFGKPNFLTQKNVGEGLGSPELQGKVVDTSASAFFKDYVVTVNEGVEHVREIIGVGAYNLVILDEVNVAIHFGLLAVDRVKELIEIRKQHIELVLTGRYAPEELIALADLVTEFKEVKHYFHKGVGARLGIEN